MQVEGFLFCDLIRQSRSGNTCQRIRWNELFNIKFHYEIGHNPR